MADYRFVVYETKPLPMRGKEWDATEVKYKLYWIEGPGVDRPATDIEVAICRQLIERVIEVVKPFAALVNYPEHGGTPEGAIRKEFGL